ncbi:PRC-barrel domain-containing protein [Mycolicibacterium frederiksbergense]|uniref:PRC-barrel domain-containing protein n=1 Tax=Mycolicibacterium frederiksbergense TaxID=117567 RepID=UPI00399BC5A2
MQLSELLGLSVHDAAGRRLGTVTDVRLALSTDPDGHPGPLSVFGLVVSPRTGSSYLGYERSQVRSPAALAALLRWRHRGTFLTLWTDVHAVGPDRITVREDYQRYSALLRTR